MPEEKHVPVFLEETIRGLNLKEDSLVVDATVDGGGHARAILEKLGPDGKLIGFDWDSGMIRKLQEEMGGERRAKFFHSNFSELEKVARSLTADWRRPDAVLFDLGLSSLQLKASGRGFSFNSEEGLEMTFDRSTSPNAREIVRERQRRQISTAKELAEIIAKAVPRKSRIHPATRTFQALRIYVNNEFENIENGLTGAWNIIKPGGRIAVISYHSLEDRIIKIFFKEKAKAEEGKLIFKKYFYNPI